MLQSRNVRLMRASDKPLSVVQERYGGTQGLIDVLETAVLTAERRAKNHSVLPLTSTTQADWDALLTLLEDIAQYAALGALGGADQRTCDEAQPLLIRLVKAALNGGFEVEGGDNDDEEDKEGMTGECVSAEVVLRRISGALANCAGGVMRRNADCVLSVSLDSNTACSSGGSDGTPTQSDIEKQNEKGSENAAGHSHEMCRHIQGSLEVCFGFADYCDSETGAMLWAGAIGLALYLIEHFDVWAWHPMLERLSVVASAAKDTPPLTPLHILEIGCGPGLVSLMLATCAVRHLEQYYTDHADRHRAESHEVLRLDVTDIAPGVVAQVRQSCCKSSNHLALGAALFAEKGEAAHQVYIPHSEGSTTSSFHLPIGIDPFILDFGAIPDALVGAYDMVVASDVVYDYTIAALVAPALANLLRPGGVALLCCEAHRDGMSVFLEKVRSEMADVLDVMAEVPNVQDALERLEMIQELSATRCQLMILKRK